MTDTDQKQEEGQDENYENNGDQSKSIVIPH